MLILTESVKSMVGFMYPCSLNEIRVLFLNEENWEPMSCCEDICLHVNRSVKTIIKLRYHVSLGEIRVLF